VITFIKFILISNNLNYFSVSDVAGISLAHHIDHFSAILITAPNLTADQWNQPKVKRWMIFSKSISIFIGCIIGMFPLLFLNKHDDKDKEKKKVVVIDENSKPKE
jgi:hypothetical protein